MKFLCSLLVLSLLVRGKQPAGPGNNLLQATGKATPLTEISLVILGTVQDAGSPQMGCKKSCCKDLFLHPDKNRKVVSLGLIDPINNKKYLFEATPDMPAQMSILNGYSSQTGKETPDGVFLSHAHIGHYSGLMYLGKEAMNTTAVPVYTMPRMKEFLERNVPWSQLVANKNILAIEMNTEKEIPLTPGIKVRPFLVPHRDEFSETVGFRISGPNKTALFIPDIDKWEKWKTGIVEAIAGVDYAFIDATFYDAAEINNRDISAIPHPFVIESMKLFKDLSPAERKKVYFIHFNHTNPLLNKKSRQAIEVRKNGFNIAGINDIIRL